MDPFSVGGIYSWSSGAVDRSGVSPFVRRAQVNLNPETRIGIGIETLNSKSQTHKKRRCGRCWRSRVGLGWCRRGQPRSSDGLQSPGTTTHPPHSSSRPPPNSLNFVAFHWWIFGRPGICDIGIFGKRGIEGQSDERGKTLACASGKSRGFQADLSLFT